MIVPAGIFMLFNAGTVYASGWGIPMATDIAFAIGMLSLLGKAVPPQLKVFLTALAVIDDLCAILIIAFFYTDHVSFSYLFISLGIWGILIVLNRINVHHFLPYLFGGIAMWYFMLHSGVHATIAGVMLAFAIPFGDGSEKTISSKLQHKLHYPVAFIILPLFALANTCIVFKYNWISGLSSNISTGIIAGLALGKPIGIILFSSLAVFIGVAKLPNGLTWKDIAGVSLLAGIGFTMSIFITLLAFDDKTIIDIGKIAIIFASTLSAIAGLITLKLVLNKNKQRK